MPTTHSVHTRKFKSKAKSLLKSVKEGTPDALTRIQPYFSDPATFKLTQAQLVVARELNVSSWRALVNKEDWLGCSFCKKWQYELHRLIGGPDGVTVCDECVQLCNKIIQEHKHED